MIQKYQKCENPLCDRLVKIGIAYCCGACGDANDGHYEIHESGPLGHSEFCNQRHSERSITTTIKDNG